MAEDITIAGVTKRYGSVTALAEAEISVGAGEFVSLLGPSGSGKTTLLMIIAGFVQPDAGSIRIGGREIVTVPPHRRDVGVVFQSYALFPHMSVAENVAFPLRYRNVSKAEAAGKVEAALDLVKLAGYGDRRISQLSGGQKQRVALARALVFSPRILLMDEPLSALDKKLREQMQIELKALQSRLGTTTIYVTHDQREALTMSDRIAVMNEGEIRQVGTPAEVYEQPNSYFVADFIGEAQFLAAERCEDGALRIGASRFIAGRPASGAGADGRAYVVLRPEKIEIMTDPPATSELNVLEGRLRHKLYQGDSVLLSIALSSGAEVNVRRRTSEASMRGFPDAGAPIWLGIHPNDTVVVAGED